MPSSESRPPARPLIGLIGLGHQGLLIATRIIANGFPLIAHDIRPQSLTAAQALGAIASDSPEALARKTTITCVCVMNETQVETVVLGEQGILAGSAQGQIIVIHSTVSPSFVNYLTARASPFGVTIVDAPVSGGRVHGAAPMSYMVGGPPDAVKRCTPVFGEVGVNVILTGGTGTGMAAKLAHQLALCVTLVGVREATSLAKAHGLGIESFASVLKQGAAKSAVADRLPGSPILPGTAPILRKDLRLCMKLMEEGSGGLALARLVLAMLEDADDEEAG